MPSLGDIGDFFTKPNQSNDTFQGSFERAFEKTHLAQYDDFLDETAKKTAANKQKEAELRASKFEYEFSQDIAGDTFNNRDPKLQNLQLSTGLAHLGKLYSAAGQENATVVTEQLAKGGIEGRKMWAWLSRTATEEGKTMFQVRQEALDAGLINPEDGLPSPEFWNKLTNDYNEALTKAYKRRGSGVDARVGEATEDNQIDTSGFTTTSAGAKAAVDSSVVSDRISQEQSAATTGRQNAANPGLTEEQKDAARLLKFDIEKTLTPEQMQQVEGLAQGIRNNRTRGSAFSSARGKDEHEYGTRKLRPQEMAERGLTHLIRVGAVSPGQGITEKEINDAGIRVPQQKEVTEFNNQYHYYLTGVKTIDLVNHAVQLAGEKGTGATAAFAKILTNINSQVRGFADLFGLAESKFESQLNFYERSPGAQEDAAALTELLDEVDVSAAAGQQIKAALTRLAFLDALIVGKKGRAISDNLFKTEYSKAAGKGYSSPVILANIMQTVATRFMENIRSREQTVYGKAFTTAENTNNQLGLNVPFGVGLLSEKHIDSQRLTTEEEAELEALRKKAGNR